MVMWLWNEGQTLKSFQVWGTKLFTLFERKNIIYGLITKVYDDVMNECLQQRILEPALSCDWLTQDSNENAWSKHSQLIDCTQSYWISINSFLSCSLSIFKYLSSCTFAAILASSPLVTIEGWPEDSFTNIRSAITHNVLFLNWCFAHCAIVNPVISQTWLPFKMRIANFNVT